MERERNKALNTELYARLQELPLTEAERLEAMSALRTADSVVDAIVWAYDGLKHLYARATAKPALKTRIAA